MVSLIVANLGTVQAALDEAAQTDESKASAVTGRFIEPQPGIRDRIGVGRHQLLTGRRGVGKSALLFATKEYLRGQGETVIYFDMQTQQQRAVADVVVEVILRVLAGVKPPRRPTRSRVGLRRRVKTLERVLRGVLTDPPTLRRTVTRSREFGRSVGIDVAIQAEYRAQRAALTAGARGKSQDAQMSQGEFEESKLDRLRAISSEMTALLKQVVVKAKKKRAIVILDDFYFVTHDEQPDVLGFLDQVFSGTGIWMKVGGVAARLNPYREGRPAVGLEPGQDSNDLSLDITLADFNLAQDFLEKVFDSVVAPWGLTARELFTDKARSRMVLACGGAVSRDYVTYASAAIGVAYNRLLERGISTPEAQVRVDATDVQKAVNANADGKEREAFQIDAADSDAEGITDRWRNVKDFARARGSFFVLIPMNELERTDWGQQIRQLENLRLLHRIRVTTLKSGSMKEERSSSCTWSTLATYRRNGLLRRSRSSGAGNSTLISCAELSGSTNLAGYDGGLSHPPSPRIDLPMGGLPSVGGLRLATEARYRSRLNRLGLRNKR